MEPLAADGADRAAMPRVRHAAARHQQARALKEAFVQGCSEILRSSCEISVAQTTKHTQFRLIAVLDTIRIEGGICT
eukprot:6203172-Pleurochrysis_carterae.AAC.2